MKIQQRERKSPFIHINDKANVHDGIVCEPFYVMSYYIGCPYECSYCYLQATFRGQVEPVVYQNRENLLRELDEWLQLPGSLRLNAGELDDSLALDGMIPLVDDLVPRFAAQRRHKLILVTKSTNVRNLLKHDPQGQVIVSFSVNAETVWQQYEHRTPSPIKRVEAAAKVKGAGYITVLRLDPMLPIQQWQDEYAQLIDFTYTRFRPDQWTLGSLRFFPTLPSWTAKVGRSTQVYNFGVERCPEDGRYRLKGPVRSEMYQWAINTIRSYDASVPIRLCKETNRMYKTLNLLPQGCCYNTHFDGDEPATSEIASNLECDQEFIMK